MPQDHISESKPSYLQPKITSGGMYPGVPPGVSKNSAPIAKVGFSEFTPVKYNLLNLKSIIFIEFSF